MRSGVTGGDAQEPGGCSAEEPGSPLGSVDEGQKRQATGAWWHRLRLLDQLRIGGPACERVTEPAQRRPCALDADLEHVPAGHHVPGQIAAFKFRVWLHRGRDNPPVAARSGSGAYVVYINSACTQRRALVVTPASCDRYPGWQP